MTIDTTQDNYLQQLIGLQYRKLEAIMLAQPLNVLRTISQDITEIFYETDMDYELREVQEMALHVICKRRREDLKSA